MRIAPLALVAVIAGSVACHHGTSTGAHSAPPAVAKEFPATRWVPASPTYVLASPTVREAQRSLRDLIDSFGVVPGIEAGEVSRVLGRLLAVDPLSPDALSGMGIDIEGGFAVFSEDVAPTFVAHLAAPEATAAFFDHQRERGLVTQSVIVDGTEVFTAQLPAASLKVSWAVAADWLWVHFSGPWAHEDGASWFAASHRPERPGWSKNWQWASAAAPHGTKPSVVGFFDAKSLIASFTGKIPDAIACAKLVAPVRRVALAIEGDGKHAAGWLALDIGDAAASVAAAVMLQPEGFGALAASAPLAAQWNVDLLAVRAWLQPCLAAAGEDMAMLDRYGVRSARAALLGLDPDQKSGAGVVALDLAHKRYFAAKLDDIPARSMLERSRTYGPLKGHSISVPFLATVDYVLTDSLAIAAIGDGVMMRLVGVGGGVRGPLAAIDIAPPALSADAWKMLIDALDIGHADRIVERLLRWHDGHVAVTLSGSELVVSAVGNRR